jgi:hypothetical protein
VVDASTCKPIRNAAVDIWHADASGIYSGFGQGAASRTFMRGIQRTNAKGLALFRTVYPAGTRAARSTSTSRSISAATSSTRASSTSPIRSPTPYTARRPTAAVRPVTSGTQATSSIGTAAGGR